MTRQRPVKEIRQQLDEVNQALKKYHDAFESGKLDVEDVADRFKELKKQHKSLTAEYAERTEFRILTEEDVTPEMVAGLQKMFRQEFLTGSPGVVKQYLSILVESITAKDGNFEANCRTAGLFAAVEQKEKLRTPDVEEVRRSSLKWRPICDVSANYSLRFILDCNSLTTGELRFERVQVLSWMDELVAMGKVEKWSTIGEELGVGDRLLVEFLEAA